MSPFSIDEICQNVKAYFVNKYTQWMKIIAQNIQSVSTLDTRQPFIPFNHVQLWMKSALTHNNTFLYVSEGRLCFQFVAANNFISKHCLWFCWEKAANPLNEYQSKVNEWKLNNEWIFFFKSI